MEESSKQVTYAERYKAAFDDLEVENIISDFNTFYPDSDLLGRLKRWPYALAKKMSKKKPLLRMKLWQEGIKHEEARQCIVRKMQKILKCKSIRDRKSPLRLLIEYEDRKFKKLQAKIAHREEFRFLRSYYKSVLPKRKYKKKKHTGNRFFKKQLYDFRRKQKNKEKKEKRRKAKK